MKSIVPLFLALVAPSGAAVLISTSFTGVITSGVTASNIVWSGDSHFTGASSTTATGVASYLAGAPAGVIAPNINAQTAAGTAPLAVWTTDYVVNYTLGAAGDTITLSTVDLTGLALTSAGAVQSAGRTTRFSASILNSSLATTFASGSLQQMIPGNTAGGVAFSLTLSGDLVLDAADLGGTSGSFVIRVSGEKPTVTEGGAFAVIDNLSLNGSYNAVPEPGVALLGGLGLLGLLRRRR